MELMKKVLLMVTILFALTGCDKQEENKMDNLLDNIKGKVTDEDSESNQTESKWNFGKEPVYTTKAESIEFMKTALAEKYQSEKFIIEEDTVSYDDQTYPTLTTSSAKAHSVSKPDYQFDVYTRSTGRLQDSYGNYKFLKGAQDEADNYCATKDYIDYCVAELTTDIEQDNLLEMYPTYEDYRQDHALYYHVYLKGRNPVDYPEDYVDPIIEMATDILEGPGSGYLIANWIDTDGYPLNLWWEPYDIKDERFIVNLEPDYVLDTINQSLWGSQDEQEAYDKNVEENGFVIDKKDWWMEPAV